MWEWILPALVRFLLSSALKNVPMESLKKQAKDWVYKTVPGTFFDDTVWSILDAAWDIILGEVQKEVQKGIKLSEAAPMDEVWKSCLSVTGECVPKIKDMLAKQVA